MPLLTADRVKEVLTRGDRSRMDVDLPPKFKPGDRVRTRNIHPLGHTRLPRYARGRVGVIDRDHGVFVYADASGTGLGKIPQHVYAVRFTAQELWGPSASPRDSVYIDLWDEHLDPLASDGGAPAPRRPAARPLDPLASDGGAPAPRRPAARPVDPA